MKSVWVLETKFKNDDKFTLMNIYETKENLVKHLEEEGFKFHSHVDNDGINIEADYYLDVLLVARVREMEIL